MTYTDLSSGVIFLLEDTPYIVVTAEFHRMQARKAVVRTTIRNMLTGNLLQKTFTASDKFNPAPISEVQVNFLYKETEFYFFMDNETYEQMSIDAEDLEAQLPFLLPNTDVQINFHNESPIGIELPGSVVLEVVDTEGVVKGQTASGSGKPAITETGHKITVPTFVSTGEKVRVNTDTGEYMERA